jgi:hypothetical protein
MVAAGGGVGGGVAVVAKHPAQQLRDVDAMIGRLRPSPLR